MRGQKAIDDALELARLFHDVATGRRIGDECWGWGAAKAGNRDQICADCGKPAGLYFKDGTILCHRCAMWRHFGVCPYLQAAETA